MSLAARAFDRQSEIESYGDGVCPRTRHEATYVDELDGDTSSSDHFVPWGTSMSAYLAKPKATLHCHIPRA
jgi:hypothetical protein